MERKILKTPLIFGEKRGEFKKFTPFFLLLQISAG